MTAEMDREVEKLMAARLSLQANLAKSAALASEMDKTRVRLEELSQRLPSLQALIKPIHPRQCCFTSRVTGAIAAASSVSKMSRTVQELKLRLASANPRPDLRTYLAALKQLEDALNFLSQNCALAVKWLEDVILHLKDNGEDSIRLSTLKDALVILLRLEASNDRARLAGGCLSAAYDKLEVEFRRLLCTGVALTDNDEAVSVPLPWEVIQSLQSIAERLITADRIHSCGSAYAEIRGLLVRHRLRDLSCDYIEISTSELDNVQTIEHHIETWSSNLEFAVKNLLHSERRLSEEIFAPVSDDTRDEIFAELARKSGIVNLISFGYNVARCKKDPIKLLKLLEVFDALNRLRPDFNRLFSHRACADIQASTRDLIKKLVYGAWDIFNAFSAQVELQQHTLPPPDGGVHKLLNFVVNYCNRLLDDRYEPVLSQVLFIHQSWTHERHKNDHLAEEVQRIMGSIELNLDSWAMACSDTILSYLFTINNRLYLCKNLDGTKLGELMGAAWLEKQKQCVEYYAALYFRESWGNLVLLFSSTHTDRTTDRTTVKKKLKSFNDAFDQMYRHQSKWVIAERALRDKVVQVVQESVVNCYVDFMSRHGHLVEQDVSVVRYSAGRLEGLLGSLFLPPAAAGKAASGGRSTHFVDRLKSVVAGQFRCDLAAV
uniref:Exocyst subunit Exo70 family protein n=1 Tax=Kalanchoe fedtschenkoi TaxID=63787 RepID=A0A7N0SX04_KALFE